jgi:hypothetical protein
MRRLLRLLTGRRGHIDPVPDGRAINAEVNAWFRASSNDHPDMGWASAVVTFHEEPGRDAPPVSPRVEFFPSPRPGEPIELAAGIELTPFIVSMEATAASVVQAAAAGAETFQELRAALQPEPPATGDSRDHGPRRSA